MSATNRSATTGAPANVGIVAIDVYFPHQYVNQSALEKFDGVSSGKYTIGLGQKRIGFLSDREDIYSITMTVTQSLLEKYGIGVGEIGRIEVGTETIMDHSKSIKSVLMQLFGDNTDVEGADTIHACYGGTNALFNSIAWVESSAWDGRYALCIATDIAEYAEGPARPSGGAGAVAILIGRNAPMTLLQVRASHMAHTYDFYKPHLSSPYPIVHGHYSNECYLNALDQCYQRFLYKTKSTAIIAGADYAVFHSPYNKLVTKSFARLLYNDFQRDPAKTVFAEIQAKALEGGDVKPMFLNVADLYLTKAKPASLLPTHVGNMYTASLYAGLASLLDQGATMCNKNVLMFSFGSGLASTMFMINIGGDTAALNRMKAALNLKARLDACVEMPAQVMADSLLHRLVLHESRDAFTPEAEVHLVVPKGAYYLVAKDDQSRREYARNV